VASVPLALNIVVAGETEYRQDFWLKIENPITKVIVETADEKRRDDEQKKARPNSID